MHREIMCKLNLDNAGYPSVQNILSSHSLFKNVKIKMCECIIYLLLSMGVKLGVSTREYRLRILENRVIRRFLNKTA
jgi:hypothetical protein